MGHPAAAPAVDADLAWIYLEYQAKTFCGKIRGHLDPGWLAARGPYRPANAVAARRAERLSHRVRDALWRALGRCCPGEAEGLRVGERRAAVSAVFRKRHQVRPALVAESGFHLGGQRLP